MPERDSTLGVYLHLARASHQRMQPMVRDKLLVLAGVEAQTLGLDPISALCRHKVLAHNARHLVRRWPTLSAALADERFQTYLKQLRRRYSREKTEHMLDSLGIELGRERALYASDLEYAAALLDTEPEAIGDILSQHPSQLSAGQRRWPQRGGDPLQANRQPAIAGLRGVLVVWGPFLLGLSILVAWAVATGALPDL